MGICNGMTRRLALAAVVLLATAGVARADLKAGRTAFVRGDYDDARKELEGVRGKQRVEAGLLVARIDLLTGKYAAGERRARTLARGARKAQRADARALVAEFLLATGRYADARKELEDVTRGDPDHLRARYLLGMAYRSEGEMDKSTATFELFWRDYEAGKIDIDDAQQAMYLALSARYLSAFQDSNEAFREAVTLDPKLLEANVEWGKLFLDKYAPGLAEQSFDDVLKINPRHPDAHAGMAEVKIEASYDVAKARLHIDRALAVNPKHVPSLLVRGQLEIDRNEWDKAKATLAEVLAVNPNQLDAHSMLATISWLRDDRRGFEAKKKAVFAVNPKFAAFYHIVARSAVREHRYREAIELEEKAVAIDPKYYVAMQAIGTGYLRLGEEAEGVKWLQRAYEGDQYNVRTVNTLELFEEIIPESYEFATTKSFKIRYHKSERKLLSRYVEPLLERAHASMVKRYKFTPQRPTIVELFQNPDNYSVRTIGLPNLGALGVCFGRVVTAMSPSQGNLNWGMVLWHELGHVFAIQISKSRVPRWYTEGLSEYETVIARPEWRRENDADVWAALDSGTLPSVADLNHNFMRPSIEEVVVAYHTSSLVIEFIAQTWGFDAVVEGLRLYGKGLETPAVIKKITGLDVPGFDKRFQAHLEQRFAHYKGTFRLPTVGFGDLPALEKAATAAPKDAMAQARLGLGYFYAGDADKARGAMTAALRQDKQNPYALFVMGELALQGRDRKAAGTHYQAVIDAGHDGYEPRVRLGFLAIQQGNLAEAETQLAAAKKLDPERSDPYILLAEAYEKAGRKDDSLREYEAYVLIEQMQYAPVKHLVTEYRKKKDWKKVRQYGELALNINPYDGAMLVDLGNAYLSTRAASKALFSFDSALLSQPAVRRPALAHIGRARAYWALKDKKKAKAALAKALRLEPKNKQAKALKAKWR